MLAASSPILQTTWRGRSVWQQCREDLLVLSKQTHRCSFRRFAKLRCDTNQQSSKALPVAHTLRFMQSSMTNQYHSPASHSTMPVGNALRPPRHIALTMAKTAAKQPIGVPEADAHISMYEQSKWPLTKRDQTYLSQANKFWSFISTDAFLVGFALSNASHFSSFRLDQLLAAFQTPTLHSYLH